MFFPGVKRWWVGSIPCMAGKLGNENDIVREWGRENELLAWVRIHHPANPCIHYWRHLLLVLQF